MNKGLVIFTIILLFLTIVLLVGVLFVSINGGRVFEGFSIELGKDCEKVVDETFEIEDFDDVDINIDAANVEVVESEDNKVKVEIYAKNKEDYNVSIEDRKLVVKEITRNKIRFSLGEKNKRVIVSLPKGYANKMDIKTDAGNVKVASFEEASININTDAGNIDLGKNNDVTIKTDAGNIKIEESKKIEIKTDAGNVKVGKVTEKIKVKVDAGNVTVEEADLKADSSIETNFGNINIEKKNDLNIETKTDAGKVNVENNNRKADVTLNIESDCGNINVK